MERSATRGSPKSDSFCSLSEFCQLVFRTSKKYIYIQINFKTIQEVNALSPKDELLTKDEVTIFQEETVVLSLEVKRS